MSWTLQNGPVSFCGTTWAVIFIGFLSLSEYKFPQNSLGSKSGFCKQRIKLIYLNMELWNCESHTHKVMNLKLRIAGKSNDKSCISLNSKGARFFSRPYVQKGTEQIILCVQRKIAMKPCSSMLKNMELYTYVIHSQGYNYVYRLITRKSLLALNLK